MTALHPFPTSRESILPLWSAPRQSSRAQPDARVSDLFVLLHGMMFTHIQLDDFQPTLARLLERLEIDGAEEREWIMMAVINLCAVLEYGKPLGVLRRAGVGAGGGKESGPGMMRVIAKKAEEKDATSQDMDVDEPMNESPHAEPSRKINGRPSRSPAMSSASTGSPPGASATPTDHDESPISFRLALQLTFTMLRHVLRHPKRKASAYAHETVNPYLTVLLTFLATVCKQEKALRVLERSVPWQELATFLAGVPRQIMLSQGLDVVAAGTKRSGGSGGRTEGERWSSVTSGCAPLDEDWCLRGMEWVRRAYDRGFWKYEEGRKAEIEVLDKYEAREATDGVIESADDDDEDEKARLTGKARKEKRDSEPHRRWIRIVRCAVGLTDAVDGFRWVVGSRDWIVEGTLAEKVEKWKAEEKAEQEEERRRTRATRWVDDDSMEVDDDEAAMEEYESEQSEDDEMDSDEVKTLKARRRYLRTLLQSGPSTSPQPSSPPRRRAGPRRVHHKQISPRAAALNVVPGYTVLVVDTNILLSSLSMFASLVESLRWTVLVPLPVIMELDGLSSATATALAQAATSALTYVSTHVRTHALSLKVQTSKGNYLPTLSVRRELVEFGGAGDGDWERSMDDLILKSAIWQDEHWVDRSALLKSDGVAKDVLTAVKVVLLSLDRNRES
jgi:protein SMG6